MERDVAQWSGGSLIQPLLVNPMTYFTFQPVIRNWCSKGREVAVAGFLSRYLSDS